MKLFRILVVGCLIAVTAMSGWAQNGKGKGNGKQNASSTCPLAQTAFSAQPLSAEETASLLYMREEEKLARDVYQALYSMWKVRIFSNIAASEQSHFDAIGILIDRYQLTDPALETVGVFTNPALKSLYDRLMAEGSASLLAALQAGVEIETTDINDLKAALAVTDNKDVLTVYGNLLNGSLKHLAAFNSHVDVVSSN